jgi:methyl-accepting chemotaxis protein
MKSAADVKELFKLVSSKFNEISGQVEGISNLLLSIGTAMSDSMTQMAEEINNIRNSLENLLKISDIQYITGSLHGLVENFRKELDPAKMQKLTTDLTQMVQKIKKIATED